MSEKSISNRSLKEIMEMSDSDLASLGKEEVIREVRLQFTAGHAEVTKRLNKNKKRLNNTFLDMEHFDINEMLDAEAAIKNEENIMEILKSRFTILFPDQKLDILG